MTTLTLRIDEDLKKELQEMAKNLGLSLNQLMNLNIRDFVRRKELNVSLENKVEFEDFSENEIELLENEWDFKNLTQKFNNLIKTKWL